MLLIDRYLLKQFLRTYLICFVSLTGLYFVVDAFGNMEEFISYAGSKRSLISVLAEYYGYRTLLFFDWMSSILALISAMFTFAAFQRYNELTALQAAGVTKRRIARPVIQAVAAVSLLAVLNRELVMPQFREKFSRNAQDLSGENGRLLEPRYDKKSGIHISGTQTFARDSRISDPRFRLPPDYNIHGNQLAGKSAQYLAAAQDHPAGYLLEQIQTPKDYAKLGSIRRDEADDWPTIMTPRDFEWLKPDQIFIVCDVSFEQLTDAQSWQHYCSTAQLIAGLRNPSLDIRGDGRVLIHSRIVQPILDMTLLFMGLPLLLTRETRNMFLAIGQCLLVVVVFMLVVMATQSLGGLYLIHPALGAWAPLILFVPIAAYLAEPFFE